MRRNEVIHILSLHRAEIDALGVKSLAVFGSTARDTAGPASDVDVLVEFECPATFDRYMDLRQYLESLLERPVDLVTRRGLRRELESQIDREAVRVT